MVSGYALMSAPVSLHACCVRYESDGSYTITFTEGDTKVGQIKIPADCGAFCQTHGLVRIQLDQPAISHEEVTTRSLAVAAPRSCALLT